MTDADRLKTLVGELRKLHASCVRMQGACGLGPWRDEHERGIERGARGVYAVIADDLQSILARYDAPKDAGTGFHGGHVGQAIEAVGVQNVIEHLRKTMGDRVDGIDNMKALEALRASATPPPATVCECGHSRFAHFGTDDTSCNSMVDMDCRCTEFRAKGE
jgi:hypothetical protein